MAYQKNIIYPTLPVQGINWQYYSIYPTLPVHHSAPGGYEKKESRLEAGYTKAEYLSHLEPNTSNISHGYILPQIHLPPIPGSCPACRVGMLETEYSCLCICCIFCCFPFNMGKRKRCNNCNSYF